MENRIPCKKCGSRISSDTFIKTGGYCMPHRGGIKGIIGKLTINTLLLFFKREDIGLGKWINENKGTTNYSENEKMDRSPVQEKSVPLTDNIDEFTTKALQGTAQCCVQIPDVADVLGLLYAKHKDIPGMDEGTNYVNTVYKKLKGVCPECGVSSHARDLYLIDMTRKVGKNNMSFTSGTTPGFVQGKCINSACSCRKVNLYWGEN